MAQALPGVKSRIPEIADEELSLAEEHDGSGFSCNWLVLKVSNRNLIQNACEVLLIV